MERVVPADVLRLLETVGESVWQRNLVTNEIAITIGVWTALGYEPADVPTTLDQAIAMFHPDDGQRILVELETYLSGSGKGYRTQGRVRAANGEWRWLRITGGVITRDPSGKAVLLGGLLSDISQEIAEQSSKAAAEGRLARLTKREQDVLEGMLGGLTSKEIGAALNLSSRTVESYRARVMEKLQVRTIAALVQLCGQADWRRQNRPSGVAFERSELERASQQ
jgi:DNA-binding CsgD family transcriptional regulator